MLKLNCHLRERSRVLHPARVCGVRAKHAEHVALEQETKKETINIHKSEPPPPPEIRDLSNPFAITHQPTRSKVHVVLLIICCNTDAVLAVSLSLMHGCMHRVAADPFTD